MSPMPRQAILDRLKLAFMALYPLADHELLTDLQRANVLDAMLLIEQVKHGVGEVPGDAS